MAAPVAMPKQECDEHGPQIPKQFNIDQNEYAQGTVRFKLGELSGIKMHGELLICMSSINLLIITEPMMKLVLLAN